MPQEKVNRFEKLNR